MAAALPQRARCSPPRPTDTRWRCSTNGTSISVSLFKSLAFDPLADFAPVTKLGTFEFFIAAKADSPHRALADLIKAARDNPGKLNVGTVTAGSTQHLSAMLLKSTAGIEFGWVPFKNSPDLLVALLRGDVDAAIDAYAAFRGNLDDGKLRALASTASKRFPLLPAFRPPRRAAPATTRPPPGTACS